MFPKGRSFIFADILQQTGFSKAQRVPPFTILKTLRFLSLGYGAYFRRSRLVCFKLVKNFLKLFKPTNRVFAALLLLRHFDILL